MKLLYIFGILVLLSTSCSAVNIKIILKTDNSDTKSILPNKNNSNKLIILLKELVQNADDMLKVYLSPERIENIKQNEHFIEFLFESQIEVKSANFGTYKINKVLLPLSGDFASYNSSQMTTIIMGDNDGYISGPLRNSEGYKTVKEIIKILE